MPNETITFLSGVDIYVLAAFSGIIAGIVALFLLFIAILPCIRYKKDFSNLFIYRKAKDLQQTDFAIQQPLHANAEVYKRRASDEAIKNSLKNHENVLVIGMPKSGKTRSIYQALKADLPDFFVITVPPKEVEQVRFPFLKRSFLVFFDDLNKFSEVNFDFNLFLKKVKAKSKNMIVVSTCRSGDEYISVKDKSMQFLSTFTKVVDLDGYELDKSEGEELAREAGVTWKPELFLGTPGSVILDIEDMKNRYRNSGTYEKSVLRACKLLKRANIFIYEKELIRAISSSIFETKINETSWIDSINHLKENNLVTRSSIPKIDVYDPTLELVVDDYDPTAHLESLLSLLIGLEDAESLFYLGNAFYREKKYDTGEKSYNECLRINPYYAEAHYNLGVLLYDMGKEEDAEVQYREALRVNLDYAEAHFNLGILLKETGREEDAKAEYRAAIRIDPDSADAHNNLGILLNETGREEDAKAEYLAAIRIDPDYADAHNNLGILLNETGREEAAEVEYRTALRINPDYADAHNNLGILLKETGREEAAEAEYRAALRINPSFAKAHNNLGILLKETGREEAAEVEYRDALRINPNYAEVHYNLANLLGNMEREADAEVEYREAIRINPSFAKAHNNLGVLLKNFGRKEEAEAEYREAIRIKPDSAEAHANLGILYSETVNKEEVKKELEIAKGLF